MQRRMLASLLQPEEVLEGHGNLAKLSPADWPPVQVVAFKVAKQFVKKHPLTTFFYVLGFGLMFFASGVMPSEEATDEYARGLQDAEFETIKVDSAELDVARQNARYQNTRGFLGFFCDTACNREYKRLAGYQLQYKEAKDAQFQLLSKGKGKVGVFSVFAVQEARDLFYRSMGQGKAFARRASMWELLFMGLASRTIDEGMVAFMFRFAIHILRNFTLALLGSTATFMWFLLDVVRSYQPDPLTAAVAFILYLLAAISMVATYLMILWGGVGASGYMIVRLCARLGQGKGSCVLSGLLPCVCVVCVWMHYTTNYGWFLHTTQWKLSGSMRPVTSLTTIIFVCDLSGGEDRRGPQHIGHGG